MEDIVARILEEELSRRGIDFAIEDETGLYVIGLGGGELRVSLANIRREYEREEDPERIVRFVDSFVESTKPLGDWDEERSGVLFALEPSDYMTPPPLRTPVSDRIDRVPVHYNPSAGTIKWLDQKQLDEWRISLEQLNAQAMVNLATILSEAQVEYSEVEGVRIGHLSTSLNFKTSLLLAPNLKEVVAPVLGWPVLAVIPDRNYIHLWDAAHEEMLQRLGYVVIQEFTSAPHPLTTEVFRISDEGMEAIGAFAVTFER